MCRQCDLEEGRAVVTTHWSFTDGHDRDQVIDAACAVAELVGSMNRAICDTTAEDFDPAELYLVLRAVAESQNRLGRLLAQVAAQLERDAHLGGYYDDTGNHLHASEAAVMAATQLSSCGDQARDTGRAISGITGVLAHLGHRRLSWRDAHRDWE